MKYEDLRAPEDGLLAMNGRAWRCGDGVGEADILDPGFGAALEAGDFIVAGLDFACDATQARVASALRARGAAAVIARSFGAAFVRQALQLGLPTLMIEETGAIKHRDRLRVDIESLVIANRSSGDRYVIRNVDEAGLLSLRAAAARR